MAQNILLELSSPILQMAALFHIDDHGAGLPHDYGERIKDTLQDFERQAIKKQISLFEVQCAKYALVAFIDEAILDSAWPMRSFWLGQPLQLQYFGEYLAGEGFFHKLSEMRQMGGRHINLLELYYVCLQLGFEGRYRIHGAEKLSDLQNNLQSQIRIIRGDVDRRLAAQGLPGQKINIKTGKKIPFWIVACATLVLIFGIYAGYSAAIGHKAGKALDVIKSAQNHVATK